MSPTSTRTSRARDRFAAVAASAAAFTVLASCAPGEEALVRRSFLETLGADTLAIETVDRSADRIEGRVLSRTPATAVTHYVATLGPDGRVTRFEIELVAPSDDPAGDRAVRSVAEFGDGVATVVRSGPEGSDTVAIDTEGYALPTAGRVPLAVGLTELVANRAIAAGEEPYAFTLVWPGRGQATPNSLSRRATGDLALDFFGNPMIVSVDAEGRLTGIDGSETTMKIQVEPIEPLTDEQLEALADGFSARDAAGQGLGTPSPQADVAASGGGASFRVTYSRPAMRGRTIWGGLVPFGEVWRTGANAATQFTSDRDVHIGAAEVPAGTYTLWTTYTPESATLIINRQTQIWGTAYDAEQDLARTLLSANPLDEPLERFTIEIEGTEVGAVLHLSWDSTRYSVPITVR